MSTAPSPVPLVASPSKDRIFNFSAGPSILPETVLRQAQHDLWNIFETGVGILEHSHRGKAFDRVIDEAEADCRAVGNISDDYEVLFLQGGATTQFALIPMNFLAKGKTADYADTGVWTTKAIKDAKKIGDVHIAFDGKACNYDHTPTDDEIDATDGAAYFHYCSNNTIFGTQYPATPKTSAPLIADTSSDMFSRPIDINAHAMIYAGAQKNLGPAGTVLVIVRKDFLATAQDGLPTMFDYRNHAAKGSRLNTPPAFGVYVMGQVFKWILERGGLEPIAAANEAKAKLIYDAIDRNDGFYAAVSQPQCRSKMNVTFRTPSDELDKAFIAAAADNDMAGLKGHRDVGGIRASIYNAFPHAGCEALAQFMDEFAKKHG